MQATLFSFRGQEPPSQRSAPFFVYSKNTPKIVPKIQQVDYKTREIGTQTLTLTRQMFDRSLRSHPFMSGAPGAAVSFTQDGTQDRPYVFVQLASSSDAERVFSTMNGSYHGRSWGTCLPYVHAPFVIICTSHWQ